jgi:hypothetical protein
MIKHLMIEHVGTASYAYFKEGPFNQGFWRAKTMQNMSAQLGQSIPILQRRNTAEETVLASEQPWAKHP